MDLWRTTLVRILIATVQVPFIRGGAEILAESLQKALIASNHEAEIVAVPFKWYPPERILDHLLACRLLDITEFAGNRVDRVIGLKFPAYLIPHPDKVLWLIHQHRTAYDLWDHTLGDLKRFPNGLQIREAIRHADIRLIPQAKAIFTISCNVATRLKKYCGIESTPLYHPPYAAERFHCAKPERYLFFPSRLNEAKRQALVLEAMAHTRQPVRVRFAGTPDRTPYGDYLKTLAAKFNVPDRVEWLGTVTEDQKVSLYARSLAVVYPPFDEDYGYVTLEAMLSSKPVLTCTDSGGPLEFVTHRENGLIAEPNPGALAAAMDEVWLDPRQARAWGQAGRSFYDARDITWQNVVGRLLL
jgi:glycosyltransferase involved in cell wall biosynthesis